MTPLDSLVCNLASPDKTVGDIVKIAGCSREHVYRCIDRYGLKLKQRAKPAPRKDTLKEKILLISDGTLTSSEIAQKLNCAERHVQNVLRTYGASRLPRGARTGVINHFYKNGRSIDRDGYALVRSLDHPSARNSGSMYEHRLVMEKKLGRFLLPTEVVDHIDGLHLHNDPSNLRVFETNAHHLRETISGQRPNWSEEGFAKMQISPQNRSGFQRVDSYRLRKERGDVRLLQILLAASRLGIDSPHLLGTHHHLEQAQIDYSSPTKIAHALAELFPEWA